MRKFILLSMMLLAFVSISSAQDSDRKRRTGGKHLPVRTDSFAIKLQQIKENLQKTQDSIYWENNTKNLTALMEDIDKRKKKQKTQATLYIVFGVAMLGVLIYGLMRKKKVVK